MSEFWRVQTCQLLIKGKVSKKTSFIVLGKLLDSMSLIPYINSQFNSHVLMLDLRV